MRIRVEDITNRVASLLDLGLGPIVAAVVRVLESTPEMMRNKQPMTVLAKQHR